MQPHNQSELRSPVTFYLFYQVLLNLELHVGSQLQRPQQAPTVVIPSHELRQRLPRILCAIEFLLHEPAHIGNHVSQVFGELQR
ncbi:hypothetical protein CYMTET_17007 [Cymbomonas tetramitiformis]|uniref:Uncharacterized protein n=1 Tax=Cymbomonas tetramitiformis TaxID=36881 RepID=A0AAE0GBD1_9CHLO|nr:hypothetical protein CYMTET_17007 [Cymbomonas tetramitiformis]